MSDEVVFNRFPQIADNLKPVLSKVVRKTAFDLQAMAAANSPTDTGFLKSSIYVKTSQDSTYGEAGSPPGDSYLLPEVEEPPDELTAYVAVGANYGIFVELGHHTRSGSYVPAQPYLAPAVDAVQPSFEAALGAIESQLLGGS